MISFKDGLITFSLKFKENLQVQLSLRRFLYNNLIKLGIKKRVKCIWYGYTELYTHTINNFFHVS